MKNIWDEAIKLDPIEPFEFDEVEWLKARQWNIKAEAAYKSVALKHSESLFNRGVAFPQCHRMAIVGLFRRYAMPEKQPTANKMAPRAIPGRGPTRTAPLRKAG